MSSTSYDEPTALIVISAISLGVAAIFAAWIMLDIMMRRGWQSMMLVMIPVYVINALYLWPITLWTYLKYGRPQKPQDSKQKAESDHTHHSNHSHDEHHTLEKDAAMEDTQSQSGQQHQEHDHEAQVVSDPEGGHDMHQHMHHGSDRPMFATVTIGVCHCGAGCVLGDIVGEWLVYGTNAGFGSPPQLLWSEFLVDFGFAFAFGIVFQYFSIAPMSGDYGPKTIIRALKADTLSLLFFEIGLFGWMAAFQIGIFNWRLEMNTVTYWWMMQIGMFIGHWTGVPMNWWLITKGIKEPCA